ncbi:MAG: hypothetical protein GY839_12360 [candidate division Zixibacteria bacterium]|nr:hypothetical protein [candidate division Zixibacteria bacterium]
MKEQEHHKKAYELYYSLGESRSLKRVAMQLNVSVASVKLWSKSFNWKLRISERNAEVARAMASRAISDEVEDKTRNKQLVKLALAQLAKTIIEGKVKMALGDLDKLIRLEAFLNQVPKGELDHGIATVYDDEDKTEEELKEEFENRLNLLGYQKIDKESD